MKRQVVLSEKEWRQLPVKLAWELAKDLARDGLSGGKTVDQLAEYIAGGVTMALAEIMRAEDASS